jgi:predicted membrane channel-forming protein YqfA (hemolysin III family)
MLRNLAYSYFLILGFLVAVSYSELVQMPTPLNLLWWLSLGLAAILAVPIAIISLWSRDHSLWLLTIVSIIYGGLALPSLLYHIHLLPLPELKILDWSFVVLCIGVSCNWFIKKLGVFRGHHI